MTALFALARRVWRVLVRRRSLPALPPARVHRGDAGGSAPPSGTTVIIDCECPVWPGVHVHVLNDTERRGVYVRASTDRLVAEHVRAPEPWPRAPRPEPIHMPTPADPCGPIRMPVAGPGVPSKR